MTEEQIIEALTSALYDLDDGGLIRRFAEAGLMTNDDGIVFEDSEGNEFQIRVVQSR